METYSKIYSRKHKTKQFVSLVEPVEMLVTEQLEFEGRVVPSSKFVVENPLQRYKGLKASDFALENQLLLGKALQPVRCSLSRNEIDYQIIQANNIKVNKNEAE